MTAPPEYPAAAPAIAAFVPALGVPALILRWSTAADTTTASAPVHDCHKMPVVDIGDGMIWGGSDASLGAAAHEAAHHALGHAARFRRQHDFLEAGLVIAALLAGYALGHHTATADAVTLPVALAALAAAAGHRLWRNRRRQAMELQADALGAELLDNAGIDGQATILAMLQWLDSRIPMWFQRLAPAMSHPSPRARIARLKGTGGR